MAGRVDEAFLATPHDLPIKPEPRKFRFIDSLDLLRFDKGSGFFSNTPMCREPVPKIDQLPLFVW
jgi:hypothetical protein